jgi:hypothetical protein
VAYTRESTKILFSQKLARVGYIRESGLSGVGYTSESLVYLQGLPMLLGEKFLKKQTVNVKYWLLGRDSCVEKFSDMTHSD